MATTSHQMSTSSLLSVPSPIGSVDKERLLVRASSITPNRMIKDIGSKFTNHVRESSISEINRIMLTGLARGDNTSFDEEPQDSGRTRSSARRANQTKEKTDEEAPTRVTRSSEKAPPPSNEGKGRKRKKTGPGGDGSDSESEDGQGKRRQCVEPVISETEELVCLCPKDVMKCIGILPAHPIISYFHDSDDSDSSCNDDLTHTVLPTVSRNRREGGES